jgi:hypothetical protein
VSRHAEALFRLCVTARDDNSFEVGDYSCERPDYRTNQIHQTTTVILDKAKNTGYGLFLKTFSG